MSAVPVRPHPRIRLRTWIYLGVYALVVLGHFAFVQAPGPLVDVTSDALRLPSGAELRGLRRFGDGHHALAALREPEGGALWLLDWGRILDALDGRADLEGLRLARTAGDWVPEQTQGSAGSWRWIEGESSRRTLVTWTPPAAPERRALDEDTLWQGEDGPVGRSTIDAQLAARGHHTRRSARRLAFLSGDFALLRTAAPDDPTRLLDDLVLASRDAGQVLDVINTAAIGIVATATSGGFFFTEGLHSRLSKITCDQGRCAAEPGLLSTGGAAIIAVDDDPSGELIGLCTAEGYLMLYGLEDEGLRFLAEDRDDDGCRGLIVLDRQHLLVAGAERWRALTLTPRGGWLR